MLARGQILDQKNHGRKDEVSEKNPLGGESWNSVLSAFVFVGFKIKKITDLQGPCQPLPKKTGLVVLHKNVYFVRTCTIKR
jgi:hypothetical protein